MINKRLFTLLFIACMLVLSSSLVVAGDDYDLIVVNSHNWEDVYNSLLYGSISNTQVIFLADQSQTNLFFTAIDYSVESVLVVESDSRLSPTASKILTSLGYDVEILSDDDTSLFFPSLLKSESYILVDKDFPLNGLSVAPYAVASKSWVFFVDSNYDLKIVDFLQGNEVVSYGRVPQSLLQQVTPFLVIDKGNKYRNGIEISKLFLAKYPTDQYVLTTGTFLESEFFIGSFPVLVVGISTTPKPIEDFFVESTVQSAVVVGQASIPPSMTLKRFLESAHDKEIKFVAKLGQTSSDPTQENSILPLNTFPIPSPDVGLSVESFFYNQITRQIEIQFSNTGDIFLSYVPSIVLTRNGETIVLDSDQEAYFLEKAESRTIQFPVDLNQLDDVSAKVTVVYGESRDSFDLSSTYDFSPIEFISIVDDSDVFVTGIIYDEENKVFLISVKNNGSVPAYADIDLTNIVVGGDIESFSSPRAILVAPGESATLVIYAVLSSIDILANPQVSYDLLYGQRNFALIKSANGILPLKGKSSFLADMVSSGIMIGVLAAVVFALLLFLLFKKRKGYTCLNCGEVHNKKPLRCKSCGFGRFKKQ